MKTWFLRAAFAAAIVLPVAAHAACPPGVKCIGSVGAPSDTRFSEAGVKWVKAPEPIGYVPPTVSLPEAEDISVTAIVEIGDTLERGEYMMVVGTDWHGLPSPPDGALYFDVGDRVMVVDRTTMVVLADATDQAIRGF